MTLVERDRELAALQARRAAAAHGRGGVVIVRGDAGAGKSTLVQSFVEVGAGTMRVLWGACDPLSTPRPLGPFHDMAGDLAPVTAELLREARQPHEIFAAVFDELRAAPTLLVVDDLHWADQGTIDLLRFLLRRIGPTSSLVLGTLRNDELGASHHLRSLLGDVARSADATTVVLEPLSIGGIAELIGEGSADPARLHTLTGGNPFFVAELLEHGHDELPATVRDAILARTVDLDPDAWELLHLLACAPEAIPDQLLAPLGVGFPALRSLAEHGLIRRGARGVAFRHDLCRLAIADTVPPGAAADLHRRLLDALEAQAHPADPAVLAHHALGAGDAVRILEYAAQAGRAAARSGAHTQAAAFFARALERAGAAPAETRADLLEAVATEYYLTDRLDDAIAASERALRVRAETNDRAGVSFNHHALSTYHWYNASRDLAEQHATAAVTVVADDGPLGPAERAALGHAYAMQAYLALQASELPEARRLIGHARSHSTGEVEPTIAVRVRLMGGIFGVAEGDASSREHTLSMLSNAGDDLDEIYSSGFSNLTYLDVEQRRFREADELLGVTIPMTVERDLPICRVWQVGSRGRLKLLRGDWDEALADADDVLTGLSAPLARTWPHLVRALVGLRRHGDPGPDLDEAWELARRFGEPWRLVPAAAAIAEQAWLTGEADDRLDDCRALLAEPPRAGLAWTRGELAAWLQRLDPERPAVDTLDDLAPPYHLELAGDPRAAATAWAEVGAPYEQALALVACRGPEQVRAGLDLLDRLGADAVAARIRRTLRLEGVASVPARRRTATRGNPAGLTNRQVEVLVHLSRGLTNAELADELYLSTKTVDHHVSAILAKLGVPGRREAIRAARELDIIE